MECCVCVTACAFVRAFMLLRLFWRFCDEVCALYIRPGTSATLFAAVEKTGKLTEDPSPVFEWNVYFLDSDDKIKSCQASATSP